MERRPLDIQDSSQASHDAGNSARNSDGRGNHQADFDVAEPRAMPPIGRVVPRPDDGIRDVDQLEDEEPSDHARGAEVAVADVPDQRRDVEQERTGRQNREHDGDRWQRVRQAVHWCFCFQNGPTMGWLERRPQDEGLRTQDFTGLASNQLVYVVGNETDLEC